LNSFNNKTHNTENYSQDHSTQTQHIGQTNSLIQHCKLRTSCDNWNVPSARNTDRNTSMQNTMTGGGGLFCMKHW